MKKVIKLIGTASWVPEKRIMSRDLMQVLNTGKPTSWAEDKLGIKTRALAVTLPDLVPDRGEAPSCAIISEKICRQVLKETGTDPSEIVHLILVSCTPDEINFKFTTTELHKNLGLSRTARIHEIPSGCAGLVEAMDTARAYLRGLYPVGSKVLVVAVNLTSPFFADWGRYVEKREWASAVIFADGACAMLLQSQEAEEDSGGLITTFFETDGHHPLMRYPAGGVLAPTTAANVADHLFSMNVKQVAEHYRAAMVRNFERLNELQDGFDLQTCRRIYLHQASPKAVEAFRILTNLDETQVPLAGDLLGNPAAAITGIMFDHDLRDGTVKPGDVVLFSVVGAGGINGAALLKV